MPAARGRDSMGCISAVWRAAAVLVVMAATAAGQEQSLYPVYAEVPAGLSFTCADKQAGYYADPDTRCQVWHWCLPSGAKYSFLCPNGTVFNQAYRVCDWAHNVDCAQAPGLYSINDDLYKDKEGNLI